MGKNINRVRPHGVVLGHGLWRQGLSLKALGLLYILLDLSQLPDWEFSLEGLVQLSRQHAMGDGRDSLRTAIAELEGAGLLHRLQPRTDNGQLAAGQWLVSDTPLSDPPSSENPTSDNRLQEGSSSNEEEKTNKPPLKSPKKSASAASFAQAAMELWNTQAPEHWIRIQQIGHKRQGTINRLIREFGSEAKALEALQVSLRQAHHEDWCMKANARLSIENWLSNGKVRQYQEKAAFAEQPVAASLSGEQEEVVALARRHPELFTDVTLQGGLLRLHYTEQIQRLVSYPASGMVNSVSNLNSEIAYLQQQLAASTCPF